MEKQQFSISYSLIFIVTFFAVLLIPLHKLDVPPVDIDKSFYGRDKLIAGVADFRIWLGDRVFHRTVVGKDGWLIYTGELSMEDYQNTIPFSQNKLEAIQRDLDFVTEQYAANGITLLIVIPPNKNTIYPEFIPDEIEMLGEESRLEQLVNYMNEYGQVQILDLRSVLLMAKNDAQIYFTTDTHWNQYGAFLAYQEIISQLEDAYPKLHPYSISDFTITQSSERALDLTNMIGTSLIKESAPSFSLREGSQAKFYSIPLRGSSQNLSFSFRDNLDLPRAIVYHDSFFTLVNPLLKEHFSQAIFIPHYSGITDIHWVEEWKPDIVIIEFTERYIGSLASTVRLEE